MNATPTRTQVLGVLNVTTDSFSDGGQFLGIDQAIAQGRKLSASGADYVDVGGESTRPGAVRVPVDVERDRVTPVIAALSAEGIACSVDTMRAEVAEAAVTAGAVMVNDVSGGRADPAMAPLVADLGVPWILMHWRSTASFEHRAPAHCYDDVVGEVISELTADVADAVSSGVREEQLIIDPGLGFAKDARHNWALLHALPQLVELGYPVLVGASRKRFLGSLLKDAQGTDRPVAGREVATAAISALAAAHGAWGVRVHDVAASLDATAVAHAWLTGGDRG